MNNDWNLPPWAIEQRSFEIIDREASDHGWGPAEWAVVRRLVHTSADFDYVTSVRMSPQAIELGVNSIRQGRTIITDTHMAKAGISGRRLAPFRNQVICLINQADVIARAEAQGVTRALAAVDLALEDRSLNVGIWVIGNAPTALLRLLERLAQGAPRPELVVGLPVGFVHAVEAKNALLEAGVPYITALGRKGGSNVAAATINALAELARDEGDAPVKDDQPT